MSKRTAELEARVAELEGELDFYRVVRAVPRGLHGECGDKVEPRKRRFDDRRLASRTDQSPPFSQAERLIAQTTAKAPVSRRWEAGAFVVQAAVDKLNMGE